MLWQVDPTYAGPRPKQIPYALQNAQASTSGYVPNKLKVQSSCCFSINVQTGMKAKIVRKPGDEKVEKKLSPTLLNKINNKGKQEKKLTKTGFSESRI